MNCRGDEDIDAKRSRPSIGKPVMGHARKERVVLFGTDQRITAPGSSSRTVAANAAVAGFASPGAAGDCDRTASICRSATSRFHKPGTLDRSLICWTFLRHPQSFHFPAPLV